MKNKTMVLGVSIGLCLSFGIISGFLFMVNSLEANTPVGEISPPTMAPSVFYDERWQAIKVYYAKEDNTFDSFDPSPAATTRAPNDSVVIDRTVDTPYFIDAASTIHEKIPVVKGKAFMKVATWKVHGHIHFE